MKFYPKFILIPLLILYPLYFPPSQKQKSFPLDIFFSYPEIDSLHTKRKRKRKRKMPQKLDFSNSQIRYKKPTNTLTLLVGQNTRKMSKFVVLFHLLLWLSLLVVVLFPLGRVFAKNFSSISGGAELGLLVTTKEDSDDDSSLLMVTATTIGSPPI